VSPPGALPVSPWADMEATGETMTTNADHDALIHPPMLLAMAGMFLAGHDPQDPLVAPIHSDFMGIAPLYIQVGGHETLLDDAKLVAAAAQRDGVDMMLEVFPEMQHVFQIGAGNVPESDDAIAKIGVFLRPRLVSVGMPLSPGTRLGHYGVTALLGQEGMGQVWQVTDTELGREVALNARSTSCRDRGPSAVKLPGASTVACRARGLHVLTLLSGGLTTRRGLRYTDSYL